MRRLTPRVRDTRRLASRRSSPSRRAESSASNFSCFLGKAPDGQPVLSKFWLEEGSEHFVLSRNINVTVTEAESVEEHRYIDVTFASAWITERPWVSWTEPDNLWAVHVGMSIFARVSRSTP